MVPSAERQGLLVFKKEHASCLSPGPNLWPDAAPLHINLHEHEWHGNNRALLEYEITRHVRNISHPFQERRL